MRDQALGAAEAQYLASNAFGLVKADCFWQGFKELWDIAVEWFLDIDFSSIKPKEPEAEDGEEEEVSQGDVAVKGGHGSTVEGTVGEPATSEIVEAGRGDVVSGVAASGGANPGE